MKPPGHHAGQSERDGDQTAPGPAKIRRHEGADVADLVPEVRHVLLDMLDIRSKLAQAGLRSTIIPATPGRSTPQTRGRQRSGPIGSAFRTCGRRGRRRGKRLGSNRLSVRVRVHGIHVSCQWRNPISRIAAWLTRTAAFRIFPRVVRTSLQRQAVQLSVCALQPHFDPLPFEQAKADARAVRVVERGPEACTLLIDLLHRLIG